MEVLELTGYIAEEKLRIAREHLVSRQITNHGLSLEQVTFSDEALTTIIHGYTREAGVRNLEREIGAICRKIARRKAEGLVETVVVTRATVEEMLGAPRFLDEEMKDRTKDPGVAIGLAWTPVGGDVLFVEASRMTGGSQLTLTGHLGDVMKESARIALSWFRANATKFGVDPSFYRDSEIHLHVPSGAIPKDGPSAGVTMVAALASALSGRPVRGDVAMTGEITLSGRVLPVGGIKEKVLAARRVGITTVILPRQNEKNIKEDLTEELRRGLAVHYVDEMEEVLALALTPLAAAASRGTAAHHEEPRPRLSLA
jgi:ATP-dependent Lon protease